MPCAVCNKTVYAMEFVGVSDKVGMRWSLEPVCAAKWSSASFSRFLWIKLDSWFRPCTRHASDALSVDGSFRTTRTARWTIGTIVRRTTSRCARVASFDWIFFHSLFLTELVNISHQSINRWCRFATLPPSQSPEWTGDGQETLSSSPTDLSHCPR